MNWQQIRQQYPHKWIAIYPLRSFVDEQNHQIIEDFEVERLFGTQAEAVQYVKDIRQKEPNSTLLMVYTDQEELKFIPYKPMKGELPE